MNLPPGIVMILVVFVASMIVSAIWVYVERRREIDNPPPKPPEPPSYMEQVRQQRAEEEARRQAQDVFFSREKGETEQVEDEDW